MSVDRSELESMIRRILSESLKSHAPEEGHVHAPIDRHKAECVDCGTRNPAFNPDGVCENCENPVYQDDPECPWCRNSTRMRKLEKEDVQRLYSHRLR